MFASVFAFMGSWVSISVVLVIAAVAWLLLRAAADLVPWYREEILNNPMRPKRPARRQRRP